MIKQVLQRKELQQQPPVLLDIGASGKLHAKWETIAAHSICIAFDPDDREMGYIKNLEKNYKKLYIYPYIVTPVTGETTRGLYLTQSPYCSSVLKPDLANLENWSFANLFSIQNYVTLKSIDLPAILKELNLNQVDWFKVDSQGLDLQLFKSLGEECINRTLIAELEPGFIDAYIGEDKLHHILKFMDSSVFWLSDIKICGTQRLSPNSVKKYFNRFEAQHLDVLLKKSPGWGEMTYLNNFNNASFTIRDYLLGWIFAVIEHQYGFALELAQKGHDKFKDEIFKQMAEYALSKIKQNVWRMPFTLPLKLIKRIFN